MLGSQTIQQYFATGTSHYVLPQTSIEWNYNLFYQPYATVNGTGSLTIPSNNWSVAPATVPLGRITKVFLPDINQTTRSCYSFQTTSGSGDSSTIIPVYSTTATYKLTFWAKVDTDAVVNLSALVYIDYHRAHSVSQRIDSVNWTKFEVYVSPQPLNTAYSTPSFSLHHEATDGTSSYGVLIDQLEVYQTTDFEYKYGNLWTTSDPFNSFRPGESFVPSGNSLCQLPTGFRQIKTDLGYAGGQWNNQIVPVSPVVYHPTLIGTNAFNPVYKNGNLSEWSKYKYFVADSASPFISGIYDQLMETNKIVIKFNLAYSTPTSFTVNLAGKTQTMSGGYASVYSYSNTYTNADIDASGTCILYYQADGTWKSGLGGGTWQGTVDTNTIPGTPSFDFSGNLKFGGSKGGIVNAAVNINSISVIQNSALQNPVYNSVVNESLNGSASYTNQASEFTRMQIVEISPRLEIDVTYYTMSVNTVAEMDNKVNPLPIADISSNMATITLSNVPLTVSNKVLSLFSNNSSSSLLKGLFRNYVKCYINYRIIDSVAGASNTDRVIPGGVFYVDTWNVNDIQKTVITAYDISKYLQLLQPLDYVSQSEDVFKLITNILDFAGFTDYDYDGLKRITSSKTTLVNGVVQKTATPLKIRFFYIDGTQQKVFDVLREIFEVYQIAAYIDAYGIMRFINIDQIFDPANPLSMEIHDSTTPVSISTANNYINNLSVYPNITEDTYQEVTKTKVGKINFTYKTPQIERSPLSNTSLLNSNLYVDLHPTFTYKSNVVWDSTIDEAVTYNTLASTMGLHDTYFTVPSAEATAASTSKPTFRTYGIDHNGYGIIENEIVSFKYKEFSYNGPTISTTRSVANSAEYASKFAEVSTLAGDYPMTVQATGRITNVNRGQFNTPIASHIVMASTYDIQQRFDTSWGTTGISSNGNILLSGLITTLDPYSTNGNTNTYNTFSTKILMGANSNTSYADNTIAGLSLSDSNGNPNIMVYVKQTTLNGLKKYTLNVTSGGDVNSTSLLTGGPMDVTSIVNRESLNNRPGSPFEEYGKYINLKFVKRANGTNLFELFINKNKISITTVASANLDTSGKFGIFSQNLNSIPTQVEFSEVYATQTALLDPYAQYHYHLPWFAEKLASNKKIFEISYMVQATPSIVGINYYDVKDAQAPSIDAYPLKVPYDWYYYLSGNLPTPLSTQTLALPHITVSERSLNYSPIYHSGFRSRFAIVNCEPAQVWIKKSPDPVNKINVDFSLTTQSLITLGDDVVMEKVFDIANINETVDITTSWVQDENTAAGILRSIYRGLDGFTRDTTISIYGNPLYEIGDMVIVNYSLKNIINQKYVVQGITQNFDTGLTTTLILNQIG